MRVGQHTWLTLAVIIGGCGTKLGGGGGGLDASSSDFDAPPGSVADAGPGPNLDAFWEDDPPSEYCGPGEAPPWDPPGGTPECPDDKNREGCPCDTPGESAACWPGLRADRNKGICRDGTTICEPYDEFNSYWGPCDGYVLPVAGATKGAPACNCFSMGRWEIDNLSPCFVTYSSSGNIYAVSTFQTGGGASCPTSISATPPPAPEPGSVWASNRLTVDCAGQFHLCYTLRAGDVENPQLTDCQLAETCVDIWYEEPNLPLELPPLPAWTSPDPTCAAEFVNVGGYGEMSVVGLSIECEEIDDSGDPYIFHRVGYCRLECNDNPSLPGCESCQIGGSGTF